MTNEDETPVPEAGDECPVCSYSPVYDDGEEIVCVGCDSRWTKSGEVVDE